MQLGQFSEFCCFPEGTTSLVTMWFLQYRPMVQAAVLVAIICSVYKVKKRNFFFF